MDTEIDQNLEQITREYVDFLDDMVDILIIDTCQHNVFISYRLYVLILLILFNLYICIFHDSL